MDRLSGSFLNTIPQQYNKGTPLRYNFQPRSNNSANSISSNPPKRKNSLLIAGIDFITAFAVLGIIHKKVITKSFALLFAAISAAYALLHYKVWASTPGRFIMDNIQGTK